MVHAVHHVELALMDTDRVQLDTTLGGLLLLVVNSDRSICSGSSLQNSDAPVSNNRAQDGSHPVDRSRIPA